LEEEEALCKISEKVSRIIRVDPYEEGEELESSYFQEYFNNPPPFPQFYVKKRKSAKDIFSWVVNIFSLFYG